MFGGRGRTEWEIELGMLETNKTKDGHCVGGRWLSQLSDPKTTPQMKASSSFVRTISVTIVTTVAVFDR